MQSMIKAAVKPLDKYGAFCFLLISVGVAHVQYWSLGTTYGLLVSSVEHTIDEDVVSHRFIDILADTQSTFSDSGIGTTVKWNVSEMFSEYIIYWFIWRSMLLFGMYMPLMWSSFHLNVSSLGLYVSLKRRSPNCGVASHSAFDHRHMHSRKSQDMALLLVA